MSGLREVRGVARMPANAALALLMALWVGLFLWRKTFSYVRFGGVYIIEPTVLLALMAFAAYVMTRSTFSFRIPRDRLFFALLAVGGRPSYTVSR